MGALTGPLAERYPDLIAIEVDERAVNLLKVDFPTVQVIHGDVLDMTWDTLADGAPGERVSVIGNLPYYITSQILFGLLDAAPRIREAVIMMQYEVAARLTAIPRTKDYGILSVATQLACTPKLLFPVSRNVFYPKPDVRSAIVRLEFPAETPDLRINPKWLRHIIRAAFNQRRKTLRNSLSGVVKEAGRDLPEDIAPKRAEELTPQDFVDLAIYLQESH